MVFLGCVLLIAAIVFLYLQELSGFVITVFLGLVLVFAENHGDNNEEPNSPVYISEVEESLIDRQPYHNHAFDMMLDNIKSKRKSQGNEVPHHPFCDVLDYVVTYSKHVSETSSNTVNNNMYLHDELNMYYEAFPTALQSCGSTTTITTPVKAEPEPKVFSDGTITQLSTDTLDKLIEVAATCNVAKVKLITSPIKSEEEVAGIIKQCKADKLREELNRD